MPVTALLVQLTANGLGELVKDGLIFVPHNHVVKSDEDPDEATGYGLA